MWPNFVDPAVLRDYGQAKVVPVLLSGCQDPQYPWRHRVYRVLSRRYPSLTCPHTGYGSRSLPGQLLHGEQYARAINASWFSPTCGTTAKELLRKHLEIPACRTCLLTEDSPILRAAGFSDMENCVFVDEPSVVDKLSFLFGHKDVLERITNAGHDLVHARHTMQSRDQVHQWFTLNRDLRPGQRIVQPGVFEPLQVVDEGAGWNDAKVAAHGLHLRLFEQADALLLARRYDEAERLYSKSSNYMGMMAEPTLRLALCSIYRGRPEAALSLVTTPIRVTLERYKAVDPDPVEWAYLILCLLCLGRLDEAAKRCDEFPWLRHAELDRARRAIRVLRAGCDAGPAKAETGRTCRASIHRLPSRSDDEWIEELCLMLAACRRSDLAGRLRRGFSSQPPPQVSNEGRGPSDDSPGGDRPPDERRARPDGRPAAVGSLEYRSLRSSARHLIAQAFHLLERRFGYLLPFRISEKRKDEFLAAAFALASGEDIRTALLIGGEHGRGGPEAFLAGAWENEGRPSLFHISCSGRGCARVKGVSSNGPQLTCYELACRSEDDFPQALERQVRRIKDDGGVSGFDAVVIDSTGLPGLLGCDRLLDALQPARFVLLDGINSTAGSGAYRAFLCDSGYVTVFQDLELRSGSAILRKDGATGAASDSGSENAKKTPS